MVSFVLTALPGYLNSGAGSKETPMKSEPKDRSNPNLYLVISSGYQKRKRLST